MGAEPVQGAEPVKKGIRFASAGDQPLLLDLYLPQKSEKSGLPLIVWVHGGAWRAGTRSDVPVLGLVDHGFAIASVDYRLSTAARFPAQVHDIKAAIRFLRKHADEYGLDGSRITIAGSSAGAHLAALVGVSGGISELEGNVGDCTETSSEVQAIVSFFGASNLQSILSQSTPHGLRVRMPALDLLLGGQPDQQPELAKLASPVAHVDSSDPPLLLIHGDQDPQMPINQSHELEGVYEKVGARVEFDVVHGGAHGGDGFFEMRVLNRVAGFLKENALTVKPKP